MTVSSFFTPKSVAIVGASRKKGKVGHTVAKNCLGFKGKLFLVNPKAKKLFGKLCYPSILDIPYAVDLAIVTVKPAIVPLILRECGKKGVKAVTVITAGYSEIGKRREESELVKIATRFGFRLLGPNCFGTIYPKLGLNTTFASTKARAGRIAFISQSGALCSSALDIAGIENFGFSAFASVGNMADVNFSDLLAFLGTDRETKAVVLYIEALKQGKRFLTVASRCKKPIVAIKAGISERGARAALTHTGSLAGVYPVYKAAFRQAGIFEARSLTNAFDTARVLSTGKRKAGKVLVVSNAGGASVLAADYAEQAGLRLAKLPAKVKKKLTSFLPAAWSHANPVDIVGDATAERYGKVLSLISEEDFYDTLLCILTPQEMSQPVETAKALSEFSKRSDKLVLAAFIGGKKVAKAVEYLGRVGLVAFTDLRRCFDALAALR